jgi:hypothetical protein
MDPEVFAQTAILIRQAMESLAVVVASGKLDEEQAACPMPN